MINFLHISGSSLKRFIIVMVYLVVFICFEAAAQPKSESKSPPNLAPARVYLVFFDFSRTDLTHRAQEIIQEAAVTSRKLLRGGAAQRVEISGHTDTATPFADRTRQAQARADAVREELVAAGIPRNRTSAQAFGVSRPRVPTADGVREPQNRRVEIIIR
jgi:outer membrane protein OmpA-like peptidoglycan-associated protein